MKRIIIVCFFMALVFIVSPVIPQEKLWVSSSGAKLKTEGSISSETITTLPIGAEVTLLVTEERWYKILSPTGEEGWMYRGWLSDSPPAKETQEESEDLFALLPGSRIEANEADTARSIRGLSSETEVYAKNRGTPAAYKRALDRVLAMDIGERELEEFLREGGIGEYAD